MFFLDIRFICLLGLFVLAGCGGGASESDERGVSEFDSVEQVTQEETAQEETAQEETPQEICIIREA